VLILCSAGYGISGLVEAFIGYWQAIFFAEAIFVGLLAVLLIFVPLHGHRERAEAPTELKDMDTELKDVDNSSVIKHSSDEPPVVNEQPSDTPLDEEPSLSYSNDAPQTDMQESEIPPPQQQYNMITVLKPLATNPIYISIVAVSAQCSGVLGALVFWAPTYILRRLEAFDYSEETRTTIANLGFSIIIVITSIFGTALGGVLLDKTGGAVGNRGIARALFWCTGYLAIAFPFGLCAFMIESLPVWLFFGLLGCSIFFLMMVTSPFQCALVSCLPSELRNFGMSYQIFFLHAFGDFPSPFLFGT
jgi:hypothetical protein